MAQSDKRIISFLAPGHLVKRIDGIAAAQNASRSAVIERLLIDSLNEQEDWIRMATDPVVAPAIFGALSQPGVLRAMSAAMREQLSDDQLDLFSKAMHTMQLQMKKPGKPSKRQKPPTKGQK
jgi:hypothetical protein